MDDLTFARSRLLRLLAEQLLVEFRVSDLRFVRSVLAGVQLCDALETFVEKSPVIRLELT